MRERITWDIREGVIGSENFFPKHAITITWKNMSFAGGIDNSMMVVSYKRFFDRFDLILETIDLH